MEYSIITVAITGFIDDHLLSKKELIINDLNWSGLGKSDNEVELEFEFKCHNLESDIKTCLIVISKTLKKHLPQRFEELHLKTINSQILQTKIFGDIQNFAVEVEDSSRPSRIMNIFVNGKNLSVDDNHIYVSGIIPHLESDISRLKVNDFAVNYEYFNDLSPIQSFKKLNDIFNIDIDDLSDEEYEKHSLLTDISHHHSFFVWGPTTDNVNAYYYPLNGKMFLSVAFWREEHKPKSELNEVYTVQIDSNVMKDILSDTLILLEK